MGEEERHYPQALKFVAVALLSFDVYVFYERPSWCIRAFCAVMFIAVLNSWAAAENDKVEYSDLLLLDDAFCCALYFLILLRLRDGTFEYVMLCMSLIFLLYIFWNRLAVVQAESAMSRLRKYQRCNMIACVVFVALQIGAFLVPEYQESFAMFCALVWLVVLAVWYFDFYEDSSKHAGKEAKAHEV